jgi:flagellar protein FliO/FliZ
MVGGYVWYFTALGLVIALILGFAWVARRFGFMGRLATVGGRRRLQVVEVLALDAKRRLVLLRRDGREHLVLLGLAGDTVIERGIDAAPASSPSFAAALEGRAP